MGVSRLVGYRSACDGDLIGHAAGGDGFEESSFCNNAEGAFDLCIGHSGYTIVRTY